MRGETGGTSRAYPLGRADATDGTGDVDRFAEKRLFLVVFVRW